MKIFKSSILAILALAAGASFTSCSDDDDYDDFLDEEEDEVETAIREDIETILAAGFVPQGGVSALITPEYTTCYSQAFYRKK